MTAHSPEPGAEAPGAPVAGGQATGAGGLAPNCEKRELLERLRRRIKELKERYAEAAKRLGLENWPVYNPWPVTLEETETRLVYISAYYLFVDIIEKIRAGWTLPDEEWINLKKKLDEFSAEFNGRKERGPIYWRSKYKENEMYELLPLASMTIRQIINERREIDKVLDQLDNEIEQLEKK